MCCEFDVVFVKILIGFSIGGVKEEYVKLMCVIVGQDMGVKVFGVVCDRVIVEIMIKVGVIWIGISFGVVIVLG